MAKHGLILHFLVIKTGTIRRKVIFSFFFLVLIVITGVLFVCRQSALLILFELLVMEVVPIRWIHHLCSAIYFDFCCFLFHLFVIWVMVMVTLSLLLFLSHFIKLFLISDYTHTLCPFCIGVQMILARLLVRTIAAIRLLLQRNLCVVHLF